MTKTGPPLVCGTHFELAGQRKMIGAEGCRRCPPQQRCEAHCLAEYLRGRERDRRRSGMDAVLVAVGLTSRPQRAYWNYFADTRREHVSSRVSSSFLLAREALPFALPPFLLGLSRDGSVLIESPPYSFGNRPTGVAAGTDVRSGHEFQLSARWRVQQC
jgi:hypothetical protein